MKKFLLVCLLSMLPMVANAVEKVKEPTLSCSCIVKYTDIYVKFKPMTLTRKGEVISENKKIGTYAALNEESSIFGFMNGHTFSYDVERGLFIYSLTVDGKDVPAYGACELVKDKKK